MSIRINTTYKKKYDGSQRPVFSIHYFNIRNITIIVPRQIFRIFLNVIAVYISCRFFDYITRKTPKQPIRMPIFMFIAFGEYFIIIFSIIEEIGIFYLLNKVSKGYFAIPVSANNIIVFKKFPYCCRSPLFVILSLNSNYYK